MTKRKLVDITLDEAIEVMKLGEGFQNGMDYKLEIKEFEPAFSSGEKKKISRLYYMWDDGLGEGERKRLAASFSDSTNAVNLWQGNKYYRTHYKIIKYLESQGFDLKSADESGRH